MRRHRMCGVPIRRILMLAWLGFYCEEETFISLHLFYYFVIREFHPLPSLSLSVYLLLSTYSFLLVSFPLVFPFPFPFLFLPPLLLPLSRSPLPLLHIYVCFYMRAHPIFLAAFITSRVLFCPCGLVSLPYHYHQTVPCHASHYGCLRHSRRSSHHIPRPACVSCPQPTGILHLAVWIAV